MGSGTTPQQWKARLKSMHSYLNEKCKLNHDQDLAHLVHPDDSMFVDAMKLAQMSW